MISEEMLSALFIGLLAPTTSASSAGERELVVMAEEGHLTAWQEIERLALAFEGVALPRFDGHRC